MKTIPQGELEAIQFLIQEGHPSVIPKLHKIVLGGLFLDKKNAPAMVTGGAPDLHFMYNDEPAPPQAEAKAVLMALEEEAALRPNKKVGHSTADDLAKLWKDFIS
jgi:hypothetical protein